MPGGAHGWVAEPPDVEPPDVEPPGVGPPGVELESGDASDFGTYIGSSKITKWNRPVMVTEMIQELETSW